MNTYNFHAFEKSRIPDRLWDDSSGHAKALSSFWECSFEDKCIPISQVRFVGQMVADLVHYVNYVQ